MKIDFLGRAYCVFRGATGLSFSRCDRTEFSHCGRLVRKESGRLVGWQVRSVHGSGGFPERSKGSDCKSDGTAFTGSNPVPPTYPVTSPVFSVCPRGAKRQARL